MNELTGQGRVLGGFLSGGTIMVSTPNLFSKNSDISITSPANGLKRHRINTETLASWEELDPTTEIAGKVGVAAVKAALPGVFGKAVSAGLDAASKHGHLLHLTWTDGQQSVATFPNKLFMLMETLMGDLRIETELSRRTAVEERPQPDLPGRVADIAQEAFQKFQPRSSNSARNAEEIISAIESLASLHSKGLLTEDEFKEKKAALLSQI